MRIFEYIGLYYCVIKKRFSPIGQSRSFIGPEDGFLSAIERMAKIYDPGGFCSKLHIERKKAQIIFRNGACLSTLSVAGSNISKGGKNGGTSGTLGTTFFFHPHAPSVQFMKRHPATRMIDNAAIALLA
ncbi:uncharacterized protein LOC143202786 [Rhynchophorus ferrugineus]|uniref:uncharacterized protein LOC143202786 n=1 Tax=Rhynchophorus ferrugineus TaxID=354439 RepID=UPI003FCE2E2A